MNSQLKQLYNDNKNLSGGGNIKQGLSPFATGFNNTSYKLPRFSSRTSRCKAYEGVSLVMSSGSAEPIKSCFPAFSIETSDGFGHIKDGYQYWEFKNIGSNSFTVVNPGAPGTFKIDYIIVGGGGGSGGAFAEPDFSAGTGGGGGGHVGNDSDLILTIEESPYTVNIGSGGPAGRAAILPSNGGSGSQSSLKSVLTDIKIVEGGRGSNFAQSSDISYTNGGDSFFRGGEATYNGAGGGGGAGREGGNGSEGIGGDGGEGQYLKWGKPGQPWLNYYFGGGGGGAGPKLSDGGGEGGVSGGGGGGTGDRNSGTPGNSGIENSGGGAGGSMAASWSGIAAMQQGAKGGSGYFVLRYKI